MHTVDKELFELRTKYFRKIHLFKNYYLVSIVSKRGISGEIRLCLANILMYPLSFVFMPVKVI